MNDNPIDLAIKLIGLTELARRVGNISVPGVAKWRANGVPYDRCVAIEQATAGEVRCEDLRPDVEWTRDPEGRVTGYHVRVSANPIEPATPAQVA